MDTKALPVLRAIVSHGVRNNGRFHFIFILIRQFGLVVGGRLRLLFMLKVQIVQPEENKEAIMFAPSLVKDAMKKIVMDVCNNG